MSRPSHAEACRAFRWADGFAALGWTADGAVDLGATLVDRHIGAPSIALRWRGRQGETRASTFEELAEASSRFAQLLAALGVRKGDRVAGLLPRVPETIVAMIGAWKAGAIWVPIFTGFGPDAIRFRIAHSGASVLCTHREYRAQVPADVPADLAIVTIGAEAASDIDFARAIASQPSATIRTPCRREDPAVLLYTSGSTGPPKGVQIAANFLLAVHPYTAFGLDLRPDDVFWPTGDPGWGYGLVCYMTALARGVAVVSHEAAPSPEYLLSQLVEQGVTNLATTPTLLRAVMALGAETARRYRVTLRCVSCCGEPLNAEVVNFFRAEWGVTVTDHYGSSEFGLPIGNANALDMRVKPGSMGLPFPGLRMAVVDDEGRELPPDAVGQIGMAASGDGYYSLGYWRDAGRTRELMRGDWMTIGDLARRDADGYFWFEGRADDVITSAGYRIGPFEVESAMLEHPAVAEAAVVGKPDPIRGEIVKAFVVLRSGVAPSPALETEIADTVRRRAGRHQVPREMAIVDRLPKTETGKIQRFLLRQGERATAGRP
ncbi:MAG: AMP-binding protein [Candidatus Rokubacteria bacterium]|nr:AMP-binding protein [Candidatus Rokubacteria bacterium]